MRAFPHRYLVVAEGSPVGGVELTADHVPQLDSAPPAEFDGPGDRWSPETLLVGAVVDCFILTFRSVARATNLPWTSLRCDGAGTLDRVERVTQFTHIDLSARLDIPEGTDPDQARRALERAEHACLISNSLKASVHLETEVTVAGSAGALVGA
jgi:organic hydroperoxide reductase OsmC/OhrA